MSPSSSPSSSGWSCWWRFLRELRAFLRYLHSLFWCRVNKYLAMRAEEKAARPSSRLVAASCTTASVAAWLEKAAGREADQEAAAVLQVGLVSNSAGKV